MEYTQPVDWVEKSFIAYVVNARFSPDNQRRLGLYMNDIKSEFGDAVFCPPPEALHITLLDWICPLHDYNGQDKHALFRQIETEYDTAMKEATATVAPISVTFDELRVSPSTIFMLGRDNGEFDVIRQRFIDTVTLLPGTKLPPTIVHSSLARFRQQIALELVKEYVGRTRIAVTQKVASFALVYVTKEPQLEFKIIKTYPLGAS